MYLRFNTHAHRERDRQYLLVRLHLPPHYPEAVGAGVVVDLDTTEGLSTGASCHPALPRFIIHHHRGPRVTYTQLTERQTGKEIQ